MSASGPKGFIMVDGAYEGSNIGIISGSLHFKNGINPLLPRFDSFGCHPKPKEVCLFNKPFALQWVAFHIVGVQAG